MFDDVALGKLEYKEDSRTLKLAAFLAPTVYFKPRYDFDSGRAPIPLSMWGNDAWGDCVKCAQGNQILRLERKETKRTVKITTLDVLNAYKAECLRQFGDAPEIPGDPADTGVYILDNLRNWRKFGFSAGTMPHWYKIFGFGELDPTDSEELRIGIYLFSGIQLGFWLPRACQQMNHTWDYNGETGDDWKPGSWGGHAVFAKAYAPDFIEVLTWGEKVRVTNSFVKKYCDEAWAVIDSYDAWRGASTRNFDVNEMLVSMRQVASNIEV